MARTGIPAALALVLAAAATVTPVRAGAAGAIPPPVVPATVAVAEPDTAPGEGARAPRETAASIDWFGFDEAEPWRRAQTLNRPILLVVTVAWNKQASRFLEDVLGRDDVVRVVQSRFVPIIVDADLRPDLRDRYPSPTWPAMTLLTPVGDPLYWQPKGESSGPVRMTLAGVPAGKLAEFLDEAADYFRTAVAQGGEQIFRSALAAELKVDPIKSGKVTESDLERAADQIRGSVDQVYGGYSRSPKILNAAAVEASLMLASRLGDSELKSAAEKQLLAAGTLIDPVDGGVYRLAASDNWTSLQYEKLLDRNAEAVEAFLDGYRSTLNAPYLKQAEAIVRYIRTRLSLEDGGFAFAQTADMTSEDGGGYYRADAAARASMKAPEILKTTITWPSSRASRALMRYGAMADDPDARDRGLAGLRYLEENLYTRGRGVRHARAGDVTAGPILLRDQLGFMGAELEAWEQTGDPGHLDAAVDVGHFVLQNLRDGATGLLGDRIPQTGGPSVLQRAIVSFEDNCEAARLFTTIHYFRRNLREDWPIHARGILDLLVPRLDTLGARAANLVLPTAEYFDGPAWVLFVGDPLASYEARRLYNAGYRLYFPFRLVMVLDPVRDFETIRAGGLARETPPALYIAEEGNTSAGAISVDQIRTIYEQMLRTLNPPEDEEGSEEKEPAPRSGSPDASPKRGSSE